MARLVPALKHYDWGDPTFIPSMLGLTPDGQPVAEAWFGTHPSGEAHLADGRALSSVAGHLPFMVKFIAAAKPLSLQVHPSLDQAHEGFARENAAGIAVDDPRRNYRDDSDKPELIIALTPFHALCGFHDPASTAGWFTAMGWHELATALTRHGIEGFIRAALVDNAFDIPDNLPPWAANIIALHPGDPAILVALLMHWVELAPGECLALEAGVLHAYLSGNAVEVMNGSDNVIRAGFTTKHRDIDELLRITDCSPVASPVRRAERGTYPSTGSYHVVSLEPNTAFTAVETTIAVGTDGTSELLLTGESMHTGPAVVFAATAGTLH